MVAKPTIPYILGVFPFLHGSRCFTGFLFSQLKFRCSTKKQPRKAVHLCDIAGKSLFQTGERNGHLTMQAEGVRETGRNCDGVRVHNPSTLRRGGTGNDAHNKRHVPPTSPPPLFLPLSTKDDEPAGAIPATRKHTPLFPPFLPSFLGEEGSGVVRVSVFRWRR